jgi:arylsulfatase A-like enzyme
MEWIRMFDPWKQARGRANIRDGAALCPGLGRVGGVVWVVMVVVMLMTGVCAAGEVGSGAGSGVGSAAGGRRLNVVWLSVEDMSPWIGPYGDRTVPTPNLDKLAAGSVTYENAFATSPVCAPARSALITGMFCTRIGTMQMRNGSRSGAAEGQDYGDIPLYEGLPAEFVRCFPEALRAAGYYCTNNSKTDYQFQAPVTVWDESSPRAHWRNRAEGQPFFAVFNYTGTHESQAFPGAKIRRQVVGPGDVRVPVIYPDTEAVRDAVARTYNNIAEMDAWVGERMKELEEAGLLESTVVVFFSDHGVGLPRGKRSCFDTGLRVPLIVRYPDGKGAGTRDGRVVSFVDFGPSVLSLAGIKPDERLDGTAFLGRYATEREDYRKGYAYANADRFDAVYDRARSVSDGRYRFTRNYVTDLPYIIRNAYREKLPMTFDLYKLEETGAQRPEQWQVAAKQRPAEEFYDSQADPWEVKNLIGSPEHQARIEAMRRKLEAWIADTRDLGFVLPETKLVKERIWPPDGKQPTTPMAQIDYQTVARDGGMVYDVTLSCRDSGASIGYRLGSKKEYTGPWMVYTGPFTVPGNLRFIEVQTHRIGHKPATTGALLGGE